VHTSLLVLTAYLSFPQDQVQVKSDDAKAAEARKQAKADLEKMQGTWVRVNMELDGNRFPLEGVWTASYSGDVLTLAIDGKVYRTGAIVTLDTRQTPKAVNTWDVEGPFKDKTLPGIYEIDGDKLRVCFANPGDARPTEFTTKIGTGFLYVEYKREKTKPGNSKDPEPLPVYVEGKYDCNPVQIRRGVSISDVFHRLRP
jgi:uncharacterized protein (TIGR03067 family)